MDLLVVNCNVLTDATLFTINSDSYCYNNLYYFEENQEVTSYKGKILVLSSLICCLKVL